MTDYNDGEWHIWRGGECPVHPKSIVRMAWTSSLREGKMFTSQRNAEDFSWVPSDGMIPTLFRVTKPYREPSEVWLVGYHAFESEDKAREFLADLRRSLPETDFGPKWEPRLFREVLE